ncbi:MAG: type 2 isopentenyl-diphosphate Delta-isomerase, partial [Syntrophomonadaceae bacterium]
MLAVKTPDGPLLNGFGDVLLVPDAVPELARADVDLQTSFLGKTLRYPVLINALTGGTASAYHINKILGATACRFGLAMAVGSMTIALETPAVLDSFSVARESNPDGIIIANCGANLEAARACRLVDLIAADALQVHLNVAQELAMVEGDRDFRGILDNVARIVDRCPVPVIAKEVGFGLSREAAGKLYRTGVRIIDNGGSGGTNFIAIEHQRRGNFDQQLYEWGI